MSCFAKRCIDDTGKGIIAVREDVLPGDVELRKKIKYLFPEAYKQALENI